MTEYTDNYGLNKYSDGDAANLRDQYNASMDIIDSQLKIANDNASYAKPILNAAGLTDVAAAGKSKTRWDGAAALAATNEDDIAAIDANLNALHANTVPNAQNLYNTITRNAKGHHMVFIGDSITAGYGIDPTTQSYPYLLAPLLGMTPHVYAQDGAGFVQASSVAPFNTLTTLAGQAISDDDYQHSDVEYVLLMGGINDGYEQYEQVRANAETILDSLKSSFPNAKIFLGVCPTAGLSRQASKTINAGLPAQSTVIGALTNVALSRPWVRIIDAWSLLWFNTQATTDGLHPNAQGHAMLASALLSIIDGGQPPTTYNPLNSLWDKSGGVRNIAQPSAYPTDAYSQNRYELAKTHITNVNELNVNICATNPYELSLWSNVLLSFKCDTTDVTRGKVIWFPICKLPTFMYLYRPDDYWNGLGYDARNVFQKVIYRDDTSEGVWQVIVQYNYRNNCIEVCVAGPENESYNGFSINVPKFQLQMVNYLP